MNNFNAVKLGFFLDDKYDNESQLCLFVEDVDGDSDPIFLKVLTDMVKRIEENVLEHFNEKQDWDLAIKDIESVVLEIIEGNYDKNFFLHRTKMVSERFIEKIYELAMGENAINRGFTEDEVFDVLEAWVDEGQSMRETLDEIEKAMGSLNKINHKWEGYG
tara:strand:+ start:258 stop:740 length:483 start_codon:yes stop_codon:yes gene_type:complete